MTEYETLVTQDHLQSIEYSLRSIEARVIELKNTTSDISEEFEDETIKNLNIIQNSVNNIRTMLEEEIGKLNNGTN